MSKLFSPLVLRGVTFANRIWTSPMCQYSAVDGVPNDWHLVNLGTRAVGRCGLVSAEATAVSPEGRISPDDTGIWNDEQAEAWARIASFVASQGSVPGIQLAHAGRKGSTYAPWKGKGSVPESEGGWQTIAPSAVPFEGYAAPRAMTIDDIETLKANFVTAANRANEASIRVIELHAAHGYLLHQFLSPLANKRDDKYGGDFAGRTRLVVEVVDAVREVWPESLPLFVRVSATDWYEGGWTLEETVELSKLLYSRGVDLIDVSSGGVVPNANIEVEPGYQVRFAKAISEASDIAVAAVGMITNATQAEQIVADGSADAVFMARQLLREPYFALHAAHELGADIAWPQQYDRAKPR